MIANWYWYGMGLVEPIPVPIKLQKFIDQNGGKIDMAFVVEVLFRVCWLFYFYYDNLKVLKLE